MSALDDLDVVGNGALTVGAEVIAVPRLGDLQQVSNRACQLRVHDFMLHLIPVVRRHGEHSLLGRSRGWYWLFSNCTGLLLSLLLELFCLFLLWPLSSASCGPWLGMCCSLIQLSPCHGR